MSARSVRSLGLCAMALSLMLIPDIAVSDTERPGNTRFLSADGIPLSDDCYIDAEAWTFFVVHGIRDTGTCAASRRQAAAIQYRFPAANVILVDWQPAHRPPNPSGPRHLGNALFTLRPFLELWDKYVAAAQTARTVGQDIAAWIRWKGISPHRTAISGHSLGAQVAAFASNECARPERGGVPVHTIIAADPGGPCFELRPPEQRLDATDARYVVVVHTTALFGDEHSIGTWDIYVDWPESRQSDPILQHSLARELVTESFLTPDLSALERTSFDAEPLRFATVRIEGPAVDVPEDLLVSPWDLWQVMLTFQPAENGPGDSYDEQSGKPQPSAFPAEDVDSGKVTGTTKAAIDRRKEKQ